MCSAVLTLHLLGVSNLATPFFAPTIFASVIYSYVTESILVRKKTAVCKRLSSHSICSRTKINERERNSPLFVGNACLRFSNSSARYLKSEDLSSARERDFVPWCSLHFDFKEERALCLPLLLTKKKKERCVKRTENFS